MGINVTRLSKNIINYNWCQSIQFPSKVWCLISFNFVQEQQYADDIVTYLYIF
jgi:hypothetical protein